MVLVSEAQRSRQDVRQSIAAQFWGQHASGVRSLDGISRLMPCEPLPLPQNSSSGLSRPQQLLAFQAVAFPAVPAYNPAQGGLVFDRALARVGGKNWWTVVLGRVRAQQAWSFHRDGQRCVDALKHADNFGLAACSRVKIGRGTSLQAVVETPDVRAATHAAANPSSASNFAGGVDGEVPPVVKGAAVLKQDVLDHEVALSAAVNQEQVGSAAVYSMVPLAASLDFRSKTRSDGLLYRAGIHYVHASDSAHPSNTAGQGGSAQCLRSALHAQGAVAVEGEALLWRPVPQPHPRSSMPAAATDSSTGDGSIGYNGLLNGASGGDIDSQGGMSSSGVYSGRDNTQPTMADHGSQTDAAVVGTWHPRSGPGVAYTLSDSKTDRAATAAGAPLDSKRTSSGFRRPDESDWDDYHEGPLDLVVTSHGAVTRRRVEDLWQTQPMRTRLPAHESWRRFRAAFNAGDASSGSDAATAPEDDGPLLHVKLPKPDQLQAGVASAARRVESIGHITHAARHAVLKGGLAHTLDALRRLGGGRRRRRPYSPWLAQPHAKVNGAIGCLARMPLPLDMRTAGTPPVPEEDRGDTAAGGSLLGLSSLSSRFRSTWSPYLRETALRIFASAGASAQVGRFTRPWMDFTSVAARLDAGMTSQHTGGGGMGDGQLPQSAFALEGRNIWHAATLSVAQQLAGPVRLRADVRVSLHVPGGYAPEDGDRASLRSIYKASVGMRPVVLDRIIGLDWVLPHSAGSGRACLWWSPSRKEAMIELRLC